MKQAILNETSTTIRFDATLSRPAESGFCSVSLPEDASVELPSRGMTMVEGTIAGFPFRAELDPVGDRSHRLTISDALRNAASMAPDDTVTVEITRIGEEPEVRVPPDLQEALAAAPPAQELWIDITPMARREWVRWVCSAKQEETRARRIEVGIDKLTNGMRRPCCFPGLNWVTKDLVGPEETWLSLPSSKQKVVR